MHARSSLVVLAVLSAGCLKDLTQVETDTGGIATETTTETATETTVTTTVSTTDDKPACGNNVLEPGEQCDDGNAADGDGCEADCTTTPGENCGNGTVDDGEECDDGNTVPMDGCENNCTETEIPASCGDGKMDPGEQCDDGNQDNTDACTNTCKTAVCGDGLILAGTEACDDKGVSAECDADCTFAECGDGTLNADAGEVCDGGEANADDAYNGCTTLCQPGPRCGDGQVQGPEECDDGTPDGDDLCNACKNVPFRYVFVTSLTFNGDLNKLSGADIKCSAAADNANIPADDPVWRAWISDNSQGAAARIDNTFVGWYVLPGPEPVLVARDWAGLSSGNLLAPINRDENGAMIPADARAWSNTTGDGSILSLSAHCNKWDSNAGMGNVGDPNATNEAWTDAQSAADCSSMNHLFCVQN